MPYSITVFLSVSFVFILVGCYILGYALLVVCFHLYRVKRRYDVIVRAGLMHGTFIFLSHILGAIVSGILLILLYKLELDNAFYRYSVTGISMGVAGIIYLILSIYLWERLAIQRRTAQFMAFSMWVFTIPWYFLLN